MAIKRAEILTPWTQIEEPMGLTNTVLVGEEFNLSKWEDITGQPAVNLLPDPNLMAVLVQADETVLAAIAADNRFYILWEEYA